MYLTGRVELITGGSFAVSPHGIRLSTEMSTLEKVYLSGIVEFVVGESVRYYLMRITLRLSVAFAFAYYNSILDCTGVDRLARWSSASGVFLQEDDGHEE
jgi:hypothetical protein